MDSNEQRRAIRNYVKAHIELRSILEDLDLARQELSLCGNELFQQDIDEYASVIVNGKLFVVHVNVDGDNQHDVIEISQNF